MPKRKAKPKVAVKGKPGPKPRPKPPPRPPQSCGGCRWFSRSVTDHRGTRGDCLHPLPLVIGDAAAMVLATQFASTLNNIRADGGTVCPCYEKKPRRVS